jgi:tetratricopeptide (TPR) repeat protein
MERFLALFLAASLYGEMKRYKESEKMFRKALKLNPGYTEAYFNLGTYAQIDAITGRNKHPYPCTITLIT